MTLAMLRHRAGGTYVWLLANDNEWLRQHTPDLPSRAQRTRIDRAARDEHFARSILGMVDAPKRLSRLALADALGTWDARHSDPRLPKTKEALAAVVESREAFDHRSRASERKSWNSPEPSKRPIADAHGEELGCLPCRGHYPRSPRSPAT